jgi:hypothetical protein
MKKMLIAFAILLSTGLGSMQVARADACMDSAEEAVAAFWSGGLSYLICKTIETTQSMIRVVQTLANSMTRMTNETIDTARQLVHETANSIDQNTRNAMNRLAGMVNDARRLAATPSSAPAARVGVATSPGVAALKQHGNQAQGPKLVSTAPVPMADPNQLRDALRQGADTLQRLHADLNSQAVNHIYSAAQLAKNQAERHLNAARRIGETSVMAPIRQLEQMLNDILRHPERLLDPTSLVNESIERLTVAMTQVVEQIHHEISSEALATVRGVDQHVRRVTGDTAIATRIHEAMTKAHRARTQQSLDELRAALRDGSGSPASRAAMPLPSGLMFQFMPNVQQKRQASVDKARQPYLQHINALKLQGSNIKSMRAMKQANRLPPGTEQRAKAELDRLLKGKTPQEAEQVKRDLKARLQTKYGNQPRVMAELNRNFDSRFAAHLRANPALLKAPAPGRTGLLLPAVQK